MSTLTYGALFAGYGGLELGAQQALGGRTLWHAEIEDAPSRILAHHWPDVPNLGDVTTVDWTGVQHVDVITGGSPCFAAGTPVLTRRGLVPIEEVVVGDDVWTHAARWRPVTATMTRMAQTVEFRPGFYSTPDHRLWLRKQGRKWNNDRRAYDRVLGSAEWVAAEHSQGHYAATPISVTDVDHDKPESLTWWQIGRFLADGYTNRRVNVYLGGTKIDDAERFPDWKHVQQETALKLTMPKSAAEAAWLNRHFGKGAPGKTLPAFVLALPKEDRRDVLEGYWSGDGHAFAKRSMRSVSVSPALTVGIQMLAASLGYSVSLHYNRTAPTTVIQGRTVNQRNWWSTTSTPDEGRYTERDSDWLWQKLRKEPVKGPHRRVYDLTVADDHSFVAAGIVVHNCQDLSVAGRRAGMRPGTRSGLWSAMARAIDTMRPRLVIWENVRGALSAAAYSGMEPCPGCVGDPDGGPVLRALGRVLGDLADLGFDAAWSSLPAADVGAAHLRWRVFLLAWQRGDDLMDLQVRQPTCPPGLPSGRTLLPTPTSNLGDNGGPQHPDKRRAGGHSVSIADAVHGLALLPTPAPRASDGVKGGPNQRGSAGDLSLPASVQAERWGEYAAAVARHEMAIGRVAPSPTRPSQRAAAQPKLSPEFVEWLMMLPARHVTGVPHLSRSQQLRALGNGVVPAQAAEGIARCLAIVRAGAAGRSAAA